MNEIGRQKIELDTRDEAAPKLVGETEIGTDQSESCKRLDLDNA